MSIKTILLQVTPIPTDILDFIIFEYLPLDQKLQYFANPLYITKWINKNIEHITNDTKLETRIHNILHSANDIPAQIMYFLNGEISTKQWFNTGQLHRYSDQPAIITYNVLGRKLNRQWYEHGQLHRDNDQPAIIIYYDNILI